MRHRVALAAAVVAGVVAAVIAISVLTRPMHTAPIVVESAELVATSTVATSGLFVVTGDALHVLNAKVLAGKHCVMAADLPDPACTPGVISDRVTQDNIASTICKAGYTATIRAKNVTTSRALAYVAYGRTRQTGDEYDHIIALELGGANDARNLMPQPKALSDRKNIVENRLHAAVCAGRVTLAAAQTAIATDWTKA